MTIGWWAGTAPVWVDPATDPGRPGPSPDARQAWDVFAGLQARVPGPTNANARSQWYERAFSRDDGALTVYYSGVGRARGTVMLSVRQSWWEQAGSAAADWFGAMTDEWHVSRLDLAADARTADRVPPDRLYAMLPAASTRSRPEHQRLEQDRSGGAKLTLGSRASARYLRCYVGHGGVRHELELKQGVGGSAWGRIRAGADLMSVWADEYRRLVRWPLS